MTKLPHQTLGGKFWRLRLFTNGLFRKWNGTHFSAPNFVSEGGKFIDTNGNKLPDGEHPTIHWNR